MTEYIAQGQIQSFDKDKRELLIQVLPWGVDALTKRGYERFEKGSFDGLDPSRFVLRQRHKDPPTGRGVELEETDTHLLMRFKVARTPQGDEQIALFEDGVETGASVGIEDGEIERQKAEDGRTRLIHKRVKADGMLEVSTTYIPAFREESRVLQAFQERESMAEEAQSTESAPAAASPVVKFDRSELQEIENKLIERIEALDEKVAAVLLGAPAPDGDTKSELKRVVQLQVRELADVITTGNEGVVPDSVSSTILGRVDTGRPFLNGTRRLETPPTGTRLLVPRLVQGPLVDEQESEKAELASRATIIDTVDFPMITVGGAGDLSMQLIKRSSPSFLNLWMELLGEAYATDTDNRAVDALLAEAAVVEGGDFDPANPQLGGAFTNAVTATGRTMKPDRIFLSTAAVAAFMDATEPSGGGGRPLYPGIGSIAGIGGNGSLGGNIDFTLQPIWVPALDDEAVDIIVGPSGAFGWAEDGTYTLQADVPAKFGRDVGLAGMIWFAPLYPAAFTTYELAS